MQYDDSNNVALPDGFDMICQNWLGNWAQPEGIAWKADFWGQTGMIGEKCTNM